MKDGGESKFLLLKASVLRRCRERDLLEEEHGDKFGIRPIKTSKGYKQNSKKFARARFGAGGIR